MLTEEDEKEDRLWHRHRCPNCIHFATSTGYCSGLKIKYYKVHEPNRYKRCEGYVDKYKARDKGATYMAKIREKLADNH